MTSSLCTPALRAFAACAALLVVSAAGAQSLSTLAPDCRTPGAAPEIPDGTKATEDDLVGAQKRLKAYLADGDEYLSCLQSAEASLGDTITPEQRAIVLGAYNAHVDVMQALGESFNTAVRAFKAR